MITLFTKNNNIRIKMVLFVIVVLLIFVILRIFYVQTVSYKKLRLLSDDLWSRKLPITAERGLILDRNGKVLADNITSASLVVVPNQIVDKERTARILSECLNVSYDDIYKHITKVTSIERIHPEGRRLSKEVSDKINSYNLDGVYLVKESQRYYPNNEMLSHVIGYVGIDNQGLSGIELLYNDYLTGDDGAIKYYSDAKGNKLDISEVYIEATSGMDIMLTIDYDIQVSIERELNNIVKMFSPDNALAIAMDPNTGEVLAMSSRPDFDPNNYKKFSIEEINRNLAIFSTYEPGSTFKIITLAASIEEKTVDILNDTFTDSGSINVDGARIKCWRHGGHGTQTYLQVVQNSCNPGFVSLGQKLGKERLFSYIENFGFGKKTGIDLNGEENGILFPLSRVGPVELATSSFGQGISVTAIHLIV